MSSTSIISLSKAEKSYIKAGILANPPSRADGRALTAFRTLSLQTDIAPLANGSARLSIGRNPHDGSGGTEILAATKLEVESIEPGTDGVDGGRILCNVTCSPAAYPHLSSLVIEDLQTDYTSILHSVLSHPSLLPSNLSILPGKKSWLLHLDLIIFSDAGNIFDALFLAARAALWDTKVPRTRSVGYRASGGNEAEHKTKSSGGIMGSAVKGGDMDVDLDEEDEDGLASSFDTRHLQPATDFELEDYWDEGDVLDGRDRWPLCITLNITLPTHFLDATLPEQASTPLRLLLMFSFPSSTSTARLQGMRTLGAGELSSAKLTELIKEGEKHCLDMWKGFDTKLKDAGSNRMAKGKAKERTMI